MKKIYTCLGFLMLGLGSQAQTIDIPLAFDSTFTANCAGTETYFNAQVVTSGYSTSDIGTFYIDFGDGTDLLITDVDTLWGYPDDFWVTVMHTYNSPGIYDVTYTFTMPDGTSETVVNYGEIEVMSCDTISGYVYCDANANCTFDGGDIYLSGKPVYGSYTSGGYTYYVGYGVTDVNGYYEVIVPGGLSVTLHCGNYPAVAFVCPTVGTLTTVAPSTNNDFAVNCSGGYDIYPYAIGGFLHAGFTQSLYFGVGNLDFGTTPDGQVRLVSTHPLVSFVSGTAAGGDNTETVSGDTLTWDLPGIFVDDNVYGYGYGVDLLVDFYTDPSAVIGDTICFEIISEPMTGDNNPANNIQTVCFPVVNAWDPNYVEVYPCGQGPLGLIDANTDLVYTIHFQNTGNFPATNILVKDYLDPAVHDMGTFEFIASSHPVTDISPSGTDGTIMFNFEGINLPDSTSDEPNSHGWVSFRIQQVDDLSPSTSIENTAGIYFDFNPPVITNTALNTIKDPLGVEENKESAVSLQAFPVPTTGWVNLRTNAPGLVAFQVIGMNGQTCFSGWMNQQTTINLETLENGIYFVRLENGETTRIVLNK